MDLSKLTQILCLAQDLGARAMQTTRQIAAGRTFGAKLDRSAYLYRAVDRDRDGNLVDVLLSEKRDKTAAEAFFRSARLVTDGISVRVTTDGYAAYPGAIKAELGETVHHHTNRYLNNNLEQEHRGIKQRTQPMGGFKSVESAKRFCRVHDEVRNCLRPRSRRNESVSLAQRRLLYTARTRVLLTLLAAT
jgi:putative transposase